MSKLVGDGGMVCRQGPDNATLSNPWNPDDSYPRNGEKSENVHFEEQHRRNVWNHKYDFGFKASIGEQELERARRERYEFLDGARHLGPMDDQTSGRGNGNENQQSERRMPMIPSIPTSQTPR